MAIISKEEKEEDMLSKFKPIDLSCRSPVSIDDLWVFWSKEKEEATNSVLEIQTQIKTALCSIGSFRVTNILIQFWAPMVGLGDRRLLTTSQQPFAFTHQFENMYEHLIGYRKYCACYSFGDGDGVIGRVFHNQLPEFSHDVSHYYLKDHPQQDVAKSCGLTKIWAFPVFEPSQQSSVGVLEFIFHKYTYLGITDFDRVCSALELAGLRTLDTRDIEKQILEHINHVAEAFEINYALRQVCKAHHLPLAFTWLRCKHTPSWSHASNPGRSYNDSNVSGRGDFVVFAPNPISDDPYIHFLGLESALESLIMRVGQGLIGNAFLSDKPYICTDLTQLSMSQYPMAHIARDLEFSGCIAICLQSIATGNRDYVLQFNLSLNMAHSKGLHNLLSSMLTTLKHHLKSFEAVVGNTEDELFVEIDNVSIDSVFESLKTRPTNINELESGGLHNEGEVLQANFPGQHLALEELVNSGGDSVGLKQRGKAISPENNSVEKKSSIVPEEKHREKKSNAHNHKDSSCSYETLKQHFGRKLEDAAKSLGVSRSTVKRWCRENNISRWPFPKRSKVTALPPIPKQIKEPVQGNVEPISDARGKVPSSADVPTDLAPKGAMNTMTVKATYRNDIIKFQNIGEDCNQNAG